MKTPSGVGERKKDKMCIRIALLVYCSNGHVSMVAEAVIVPDMFLCLCRSVVAKGEEGSTKRLTTHEGGDRRVFFCALCSSRDIGVSWSSELNVPSEYTRYLSCWHMEVVSCSLVHVSDSTHVAIEVKGCT